MIPDFSSSIAVMIPAVVASFFRSAITGATASPSPAMSAALAATIFPPLSQNPAAAAASSGNVPIAQSRVVSAASVRASS